MWSFLLFSKNTLTPNRNLIRHDSLALEHIISTCTY